MDKNIDIESIVNGISWDVEKARCLVGELFEDYFSADPDRPTEHILDHIRDDYKKITVMIALVSDMLDKIGASANSMDR